MSEPSGGGAASKTVARRLFPFLGWFERYSAARLRADLMAGLTVALVLIPQSMAYAQLAGLPAYYGLYAAFLPPMIAALFGSSYQLATGPVAVVSLMTAASLSPLATAGSAGFVAYAVLLSLLVGIFQLLLGLLRLGLVVNFLSHPVVNGFTNAAALIIATSQLSKLFGVTVDDAEHHYETVYRVVVAAIHYTHWPTLGLAAAAIAIMVGLRKLKRKLPDVLVAVVFTTLIAWWTGYERNQTVPIEQLQAPEVVEAIQSFNSTLQEADDAATRKVQRSSALRALRKTAHGEHTQEMMDIEHDVSVLDLKLGELNRRAAELRARLRDYHLAMPGGQQAQPQLRLAGQVPEGWTTDGRVWRLKVGSQKLDITKLKFMGGGAVVGAIPKGLRFGLPDRDWTGKRLDLLAAIPTLFSSAIVISLLGFMEAISIAKAVAAKTGQRLDPNQELIGQGLANIVGSFAQACPVSGSFSRSAVSLQAGAVTGLANVFGSAVVLLTLLLFTPLLYHLPQSVLAAIIMMAVVGLLNVRSFTHAWRAQKHDGAISVLSFVCTLGFAPHLDKGIMVGVGLSLLLYLLRNMKPDIALLSKHSDGTYRNASRFDLPLCKHIAVVRFNGSLFFANVNYLEDKILEQIATMPQLRHVLIVGNGINELDASGEEALSVLVARLRESGYDVSLSGLNDSVLDVLRRTRLYERIGEDHLFRSVALALEAIHGEAHRGSSETRCPLVHARFAPLPVARAVRLKLERSDEDKDALKPQDT